MSRLIITIDGPAASGKSTIARLLAAKLNATFLDTGAMYRAATLAAMKARIDLTSPHQVMEILSNTQFEFISAHKGMRVHIDGVDVTEDIRHPKVTANARFIAGLAPARKYLVTLQRDFAENHGRIITEGRDQGTVAFPDADVKFFLTADLGERTRRRQAELKAKGVEHEDEEISQAIEKRDESDKNRTVGPLKVADNAITVDTTNLSIEQVVDKLLGLVKERCSGKQ
jgi:cytidylate kinase